MSRAPLAAACTDSGATARPTISSIRSKIAMRVIVGVYRMEILRGKAAAHLHPSRLRQPGKNWCSGRQQKGRIVRSGLSKCLAEPCAGNRRRCPAWISPPWRPASSGSRA
jgi:hypothetical protein